MSISLKVIQALLATWLMLVLFYDPEDGDGMFILLS
jgi:hypothetical protein